MLVLLSTVGDQPTNGQPTQIWFIIIRIQLRMHFLINPLCKSMWILSFKVKRIMFFDLRFVFHQQKIAVIFAEDDGKLRSNTLPTICSEIPHIYLPVGSSLGWIWWNLIHTSTFTQENFPKSVTPFRQDALLFVQNAWFEVTHHECVGFNKISMPNWIWLAHVQCIWSIIPLLLQSSMWKIHDWVQRCSNSIQVDSP